MQQKIMDALRLESSGVPIYVQLRDQLLRWVTAGALKPGDQMPTMRQVAVAVRVDLNTVRHAYDALERMGAIVLIRGRGSFVAPDAHHLTPAPADTADVLARQDLDLAATAGNDPRHLAERILHLIQDKATRQGYLTMAKTVIEPTYRRSGGASGLSNLLSLIALAGAGLSIWGGVQSARSPVVFTSWA